MKVRTIPQICLVGLATFGYTVLTEALPAKSRADLICPTTNPADCYPKLFQPTKDFQVIKDEQDLPPGLHVRMNIYTGLKEARLNIPMEGVGELNPELPDTHDSSIVVIPQPEEAESENDAEEPAMRDRYHQDPPPYESAGKIQQPPPTSNDSSAFTSSLSTLTSSNPNPDPEALTNSLLTLTDLAHDIYYGDEIVKNSLVLETLFKTIFISPNATNQILAANIIGHSVQNNPTALSDLLASWERTDIDQTLGEALYHILKAQSEISVMKAKIYALNGLIKDHGIRDIWMKAGGMDILLDIYKQFNHVGVDAAEEARKSTAKTLLKVMEFVTDNFLDEEMSAEPGVWPHVAFPRVGGACEAVGRGMDGNCWMDVVEEARKERALDGNVRDALEQFQEVLRVGIGGKKVIEDKLEL